ncbi:MAG TPA: hypothetical protein VK501_28525 [Baekduia sp.]|uniref:hypothetical protein n=1 Tax=Baekduia sp. TaxID=2600305 RepID=UPI002B6B7577|nr:hypothetical protein [Baekduia sp.]HMJ37888.1 hypothetical protein [Baekduia sp.]
MDVRFPRLLEGSWLEDQHDVIVARRPDTLVIDIGGLRRSLLLGDARLLALLADARQHGVAITLSTGRAPVSPAGDGRMWSLFTGSPAGLILAQMADAVLDPDGADRRDEILAEHTRLAMDDGHVGWGTGRERALVSVARLGGPAPDPPLDRRTTFAAFAGRFRTLTGLVFERPMGGAHMVALARFAAEALSNTALHGVTDHQGHRVEGMRLLLVRRLPLVQEGTEADLRSGSGLLDAYLSSAREWLSPRAGDTYLAEVTIADTGVGIAGRLGGPAVHDGPIAAEWACFERALKPGTTSKTSAESDAGMGLDKMLTSARQLGGLAIFRSGRLEARYDGLTAARGGQATWAWNERTMLAGTAVSFLFPWHQRTQLQLPVDPPR